MHTTGTPPGLESIAMNTGIFLTRRQALCTLGSTVAAGSLLFPGTAHAAETPKTGLALVIYALGVQQRKMKAEDSRKNLFEPFTFLEYCRRPRCGRHPGATGAHLPRKHASGCGPGLTNTACSSKESLTRRLREDDVQRFESEIHSAARVGARAVRTVILPGRRYERFRSLDEYRQFAERGERALQRAVSVVERYQVRLAVENHKDQRLDERLSLLQKLNSPFLGACVDVGNSFALLEDPLTAVQGLAPFAFSVHLKDHLVCECDDGFLLADAALGDGFLPLEAMVNALQAAQPDLRFCLETITRNPLRVPCFAETYWPTFADVPARDLAMTLRTVRMHASLAFGEIDSLPLDEQVAAEQTTIARSLDYARRQLRL